MSEKTEVFDFVRLRVRMRVERLLAVHEHWHVRVMTDVVADAAHDGASNLAETARAHDDVADLLFLRERAEKLARLLVVGDESAGDLTTQQE